MSLLLLFHPGVSGSPPPVPDAVQQYVQIEGGGGGDLRQRTLGRRRSIHEDDEEIMAMLAAFFGIRR